MNANELADMIDSENWVGMDDKEHIEWEMKAATMLRQLQAEITKLKLEWQYMYDRANMDSTSEPVAWMSPDGKVSDTEGKLFYIPLYTHPVKELTDSEIEELIWNTTDMKDFAKAILRKAQEK